MHGFPPGRQRLKAAERKITRQVCISGARKRLEVSLGLNFGGGRDPVPPDLPLKGQRSPFLLTLLSRLRGPLGLGGAALQAAFGFVGPGSQRRRGTGNRSRSAAPPSPVLGRPGAGGQEAPGFSPVGGQRALYVPDFPTSEGSRSRLALPHGRVWFCPTREASGPKGSGRRFRCAPGSPGRASAADLRGRCLRAPLTAHPLRARKAPAARLLPSHSCLSRPAFFSEKGRLPSPAQRAPEICRPFA